MNGATGSASESGPAPVAPLYRKAPEASRFVLRRPLALLFLSAPEIGPQGSRLTLLLFNSTGTAGFVALGRRHPVLRALRTVLFLHPPNPCYGQPELVANALN